MDMRTLFTPDIENTQEHGRRVSDLFYKLGYSFQNEKIDGLDRPILIWKIPFSIRILGVPSGIVSLVPSNIPHMIGFGQKKTEAEYRNMHDLTLPEMLEIPNMIADPDMVFRSNTKPNSSILVCHEVKRRGNPVVLAMKMHIRSTLDAGGIVVSGYEKDNSPREFFRDLYGYGYCIYDAQRSEYFKEIKLGSGAKDHPPGPIPAGAVTCTDPIDKYSSSKGISPSDNQMVLTKDEAVKKYIDNSKELIGVLNNRRQNSILSAQNLEELGYHTLQLPYSSILSGGIFRVIYYSAELKMEAEYRSIIEIDRNISGDELVAITTVIESAFSNRAGTVRNASNDPYVFIFGGGEAEWSCLGLGDSILRDNPAMKGKISSWQWIESDPDECVDTLKIFRKHGFDI